MGNVVPLHGRLQIGRQLFNTTAIAFGHFITQFAQRLLDGVGQLVGLVARLNQLPAPLVVSLVLASVAHHLLHIIFAQVGRSGDADTLFFAGSFVLGRDVKNTVGVNVKGNFNLGHTAGRRWNAFQPEFAQGLVVTGHGPFTLQDVNINGRLAVLGGAEQFRLARGNGRIPRNQGGHDPTESFQPQA